MNAGVTEDSEEIFFKEKDEGNILTGKLSEKGNYQLSINEN